MIGSQASPEGHGSPAWIENRPTYVYSHSGSTRAHSVVSMNQQIFIRLTDDGSGFIYSVRRGAEVIDSAIFDFTDPSCPEERYDEYYGGSLTMD